MAYDKYGKNDHLTDGDEEDESGSGGSSGQIEFVDFLNTNAERRDDLMSEQDKRHLLIMHKEVHEEKVKHQKEKIERNKDLKAGKEQRQSYGFGAPGSPGGGGSFQYKENPALANYGKGVDNKVIGLPNENIAETNQANREELQNQLRNKLGMQPKFNPKPSGPY